MVEWILGFGFVAFGVWALFPDTADEPASRPAGGLLVSTAVVFFLVEMGDKTKLATVALGTRFGSPVMVTAGTTLGMLAADGLAVFAGTYTATKVPMVWVRRAAAALFFGFGASMIVRTLNIFKPFSEGALRPLGAGDPLDPGQA